MSDTRRYQEWIETFTKGKYFYSPASKGSKRAYGMEQGYSWNAYNSRNLFSSESNNINRYGLSIKVERRRIPFNAG